MTNTQSLISEPDAQPFDEADRLRVLRAYEILDTPAKRAFDKLAQAAARICGAPIVSVSLVDETRQWFKARGDLNVRFYAGAAIRSPDGALLGALCVISHGG